MKAKHITIGTVATLLGIAVALTTLGWLPVTSAEFQEHVDEYKCARAEFRWDQAHAQLRREEAHEEPELDHIIELESRIARAQEDIDKYC